MDDKTTVIANEALDGMFSELKRVIPRIALLLQTNPSNLHVVESAKFTFTYMNTKYRDRLTKCEGVLEGMPPVITRRAHSKSRFNPEPGFGIFLYNAYPADAVYAGEQQPTLQYVSYVSKSEFGPESYIVIKKNDLFKLKRHIRRQNKAIAKHSPPAPILAEGILEDIFNNTIGFLKNAKKIEKYGVKIKRGVILDGPPGNGKTMVCRYIQDLCSKHGFRWAVISSADIDEAYQHKTLDKLFSGSQISFFDDIDISYLDRTKGNGKIACSLLAAMDGLNQGGHIVRIFTTNENVDSLDPAFIRPGRIDRCITIDKPTTALRLELVRRWPKEIQENIDVDSLLLQTHHFSFAELEAVRTFLVSNFALDDKWNLNKALDDYHRRATDKKKKGKVGF